MPFYLVPHFCIFCSYEFEVFIFEFIFYFGMLERGKGMFFIGFPLSTYPRHHVKVEEKSGSPTWGSPCTKPKDRQKHNAKTQRKEHTHQKLFQNDRVASSATTLPNLTTYWGVIGPSSTRSSYDDRLVTIISFVFVRRTRIAASGIVSLFIVTITTTKVTRN